jgi:hypothetical protein
METSNKYPWTQDLKKGDLIAVADGYGLSLGLFKTFKEGTSYDGCRLQYYDVPSHNHRWHSIDKRLKHIKESNANVWVSYINARAEDRIIPIDKKHLTPTQLEYINLIRKII